MKQAIDLILLTGFLGSGKTTLVNHLLTERWTESIGLLVNDFGTVNVDGALLRRRIGSDVDGDVELFEVADGSIFCTCKSASFVMGLRMFARMEGKRRPATLVVEASGMSDPSGLTRLLTDNSLDDEFRVARVVCMIDPHSFVRLKNTLTAIPLQVECADLIVINKVDKTDDESLDRLEREVRALNASADIQRTTYAKIDTARLLGAASLELRGDLVSCSTPESRPAAITVGGLDVTRAEVERFFSDTASRMWRVKGWLRIDGDWSFVTDNSGGITWRSDQPPTGVTSGVTVICAPEDAQAIADRWRATVGSKKETV